MDGGEWEEQRWMEEGGRKNNEWRRVDGRKDGLGVSC